MFFFSSRRRHTRSLCDWSSDVCSSDLVTAIESRDPTTSGHSFRVANLTVGLASVVDHVTTGPYASLRFTTDEMMELRYAALLHDFGKVGVREQVLVKAKKLHPAELDRIRQRAELIKRGLQLRQAGEKIDRSEEHTSELQSHSDLVCRLLLEK